ncbi:MAG: phosphatase PAP2 family protein [Bacillota bacterium]
MQAVIAAARFRCPALTGFMKTITFLGTKAFLVPATAIATAILFSQRNRQCLVFPAVMLAAWFSMEGLKFLFGRPRPEFSPLLAESSPSFPSGHALMGTLFFGFLTALLISRTPSPPVKRLTLTASCLFLFLLGFSRIYLGVHYPTDVLAGYAGGLFFLGLAGPGRQK